MSLYDRYLAFRVRTSDADGPGTVALVLTERDLLEPGAYETLEASLRWAFELGAERVLVYASVLDSAAVDPLRRSLDDLDAPRELAVRGPEDDRRAVAPIQVSIGLGGKAEFAKAVRNLATAVEAGALAPADIDESAIEERLVFPTTPDLVIKTGGEHLSDFVIWQSVYAELYFTDVNWRDFRRRDFLRAVREYQDRQRRFGR